jgi:hypothetical protein
VDQKPNVILPIFCSYCGGAVEAQCLMNDNEPAVAHFQCPYGDRQSALELAGEIVLVVPRNLDEPSATRIVN